MPLVFWHYQRESSRALTGIPNSFLGFRVLASLICICSIKISVQFLINPMARFRNNKRKREAVARPVAKKPSGIVDHVTGDKIPKSFVFSRGKLPGPLKQLQMDLRKLMLPYTALKLKEKKRNNLKDYLNVAGPMGVTHFLILSKTESASYLKVARTPQGPTLTFKICDYSLALDVAQSQLHPRCPQELFKNPPLIVLSGFGTGDQHLKLTTIMFQNIFPSIDINTVSIVPMVKLSSCQRIVLLNYNKETKLIDFRHYSIRLQPVGVSRRLRKFVQNHQAPDLRTLQDVSDFVTRCPDLGLDVVLVANEKLDLRKSMLYEIYLFRPGFYWRFGLEFLSSGGAGYGSESEADDEAATVSLASDLGRVNQASSKSAVKLQEIGPRMTLQLMKVEEGLCAGGVIFNEHGPVDESKKRANQEESSEEDNGEE
ncbi:hypothetical protein Sjap_007467 [Stephania japonica]|uniref:Brix domain-containing protein n=1 Tax=Stephania japonica TaxID=461633 RepID=A0AAP0JMR1_9MAGN